MGDVNKNSSWRSNVYQSMKSGVSDMYRGRTSSNTGNVAKTTMFTNMDNGKPVIDTQKLTSNIRST